ncbi:MAG TPA: response regulator transcription factor [Candidatus Solibacter sp.]|nr:response regulator transcription factor [Candidatus Solibacter sp.]
MPIRVAIVEDDRTTRQGLALLIGGTPGYECVGDFRSVEDALRPMNPPPDVILLDINLPGVPGTEGVKLLRDRYTAAQVVMLTVFDAQDHVFESICNGACGYLLKKTAPARLLEAIAEAHEGGAPMTPEIARRVVTLFQKTVTPRQDEDHGLSPRELAVLGLLAEGYSYTALAGQLGITANTVRNHIRAIYEKLHVHSRSEAVSKALRKRVI